MNHEELEKYKNALITLEKRLKQELSEIPDIINFGDQADPEEDEADESVTADEQASIKGEIRARLENVRIAMHNIENQTYGLCTKCQAPIEKDILDIVPESNLCRTHKLKH